MKIVIKKIKIENFRGIKNFEGDFSENLNIIQGYNGVGKTTVLSAITWCLFGKLFDERKAGIPILPIFGSDEEQKLVASVTLYLNNDFVIQKTFDGNRSDMYYGIEIEGKTELKKCSIDEFNKVFKDNFLDIEELKNMMSLSYVQNLHWTELKKLVFDIVGDVNVDDVLKIKEFPNIEKQLKLFGYTSFDEQTRKSIKDTTLAVKQGEIELNNYEQIKYKYLNELQDEQTLLDRKDELQAQISSYERKIQENADKTKAKSEKQEELNEKNILLRSYMNDLNELNKEIFEISTKSQNATLTYTNQRAEELMSKKEELNEMDIEIANYENKIEQKKEEINVVKTNAKELNARKVQIVNQRCETCGQLLPKEQVENTIKKLEIEKREEMQVFKAKYEKLQQEAIALINQRDKIKIDREKALNELENLKTKKYVTESGKEVEEIEIRKKDLETKKKKIENSIDTTKITINQITEEIGLLPEPEVLPDLSLIQQELDQINTKLSSYQTLKGIEKDIDEKEGEIERDKVNLEILNERLKSLDEYRQIYSSLVKDKVKDKFEIVEFITEEYTKDGKINETFKISKDGIPYAELNTAMKILTVIDLMNGIQKSKNLSVPLLVDNCESIIDIPKVPSQMIIARCIAQKERKIELERIDNNG